MPVGAFTRTFGTTLNAFFKRFGFTILRALFIYSISLFFVQLPTLWNLIMTFGKDDERTKVQKRVRAKIINPSDPSSPYRAIEVLHELRSTPDDHIQTLADIPPYCFEHFADKETLGVREILDVEDEKQPNGKIFKKVLFFVLNNKKKRFHFLLISLYWENINGQIIVKQRNVLKLLDEVYYH
jgi:hypothetical protein